jgi:beta-mannosidase
MAGSRATGNVRSVTSVPLDGTWRAAIADEDLRRGYPEPTFDDDGWEPIEVPGHWRGTPAFAATDGPVLHRRRFGALGTFGPGADRADEADEPRRSWLVLDGVLYTSDVWLDGAYLGDTEGSFFPHAFEITDALAAQSEHVLALEVSCRPEGDGPRRNLTGVLQDESVVPRGWNPGGIWRPVRVEQTGPVRIRHLRAVCRDASAASATVALRAVLDTVASRTIELVTTIGGVEHRRTQPLASGENRVEWTVAVPHPVRWWPHALGDPALHDLRVAVETDGGLVSDERHRRIGLRSVELRDWVASVNGERLFLKGAALGPTATALADATPDDVRADVALARAAGLDLLRVRGHVGRPELYDAADGAGMLLWQDLPMVHRYQRSVRGQARRQARELVDLLGHHPSVLLWCGHDEPVPVDAGPDGEAGGSRVARAARAIAGQLLPTWNKSVLDRTTRRVLEHTDGSRPVVPHSGVLPHPLLLDGTDTPTSFGWSYGSGGDLAPALRWWPRLARFVTVAAPQSVPASAGFADPDAWPDLDWAALARDHGLDRAAMAARVPATASVSFDGWRDETQRYQAALIREQVEVLRRLKYRPCGGFVLATFADGHPAISGAVLGHDRAPKAGFAALAAACAPVIVVTDPLPPIARPGDRLEADIHVVSDRRIALDDMMCSVHLLMGEEEVGRGRTWTGTVPPDSCARIGRLDLLVPPVEGRLTIEVALRPAGAGTAPGRPAGTADAALATRSRHHLDVTVDPPTAFGC